MRRTFVILENIGSVALAVAWLFYGVQWAGNLFLFNCWIVAVGSTITLLVPKEKLFEARPNGPCMPEWFIHVCDVAVMLLAASQGHFWVGANYVASVIATCRAYDAFRKRAAKQPA